MWDESLPEAEVFFSSYYYPGAFEIAEDEDDLWDAFIKDYGKEYALIVADQLNTLVQSDIKDKELKELIIYKLGSSFSSLPGQSRTWLIQICNHIHHNT